MKSLRIAILAVVFRLAAMPGVANAYTVTTQTAYENLSPGSSAVFTKTGATVSVVPPGPFPNLGSASIGYNISFTPDFPGELLPNRISYSAHLPPGNVVTTATGTVAGSCFGRCSGQYYGSVNNEVLLTGSGFSVTFALTMSTPGSGNVTINPYRVGVPEKYEEDQGATVYVPDGTGEATIEEGADVANDTTGSYLTSESAVAVVQGHGYSDYVSLQSPSLTIATKGAGWSPGYLFSSSNIPITHFLIPHALPGGDSEFKVIFGDYESHILQAGVAFDFTAYVPGGVTAFILKGIDPQEGLLSDTAFPFEHRFRFAEEGATVVRHGVLLPGDYSLGGVLNEKDYSIWRANFGQFGEYAADGSQDGVVDAADYIVWRKLQALATPAAGSAALSTVPEPSVLALLATIFAVYAMCRSQSKIN